MQRIQTVIRNSFHWLGLGALLLALALFGRATADSTAVPNGFGTVLVVLGGLALGAILIGLLRFMWAISRLRKGEKHG